MSDLIKQYRSLITSKGIEPSLFKVLTLVGIEHVGGYLGRVLEEGAVERGTQEADYPCCYLRALSKAFESLDKKPLSPWLIATITGLCSDTSTLTPDQQVSVFAELEVFGHLNGVFPNNVVEQIEENDGKNGKTPDFKVEDDLFVEVYCPDESNPERGRVADELIKQSGIVRMVISRPVTGSKPLAVKYATNQTIARVVGAKRSNDQTQDDSQNILWIDVKQKLKLSAKKTLPLESVNCADQTFIGCFGIWHAFYGEVDVSIFPTGRFTLRHSGDLESDQYTQRNNNGLFRERPSLSAAVISCVDGNVVFQNPWAVNPISSDVLVALTTLYQFKPEYSWISPDAQKLLQRIESCLSDIDWLLKSKVIDKDE